MRDPEPQHSAAMTGAWAGCLLALCAVLLARWLAPALPGSAAGIGHWIQRTDQLAAWSSQVATNLGVAFGVVLLSVLRAQTAIPNPIRQIITVASAGLLFIVVQACARPLGLLWAIALALLSLLVAALAASMAIRDVRSRASGLVLALVSCAGSCYLMARLLAIIAGDAANVSLFRAARGIATAGTALDTATWIVAGFGLLTLIQGKIARRVLAAGFFLGVTLLTIGAFRGAEDGASLWQILLLRTLSDLSPHPDPFVPLIVRYWLELALTALVAITLLTRRRLSLVELSVCLAVLSRASIDIPFCALLLALSALCVVASSIETGRYVPLGSPSSSHARSILVSVCLLPLVVGASSLPKSNTDEDSASPPLDVGRALSSHRLPA